MTNDMPELPSPRPDTTRRIPLAIGAVLIGAVIGFAGVYGIGGLKPNTAGDSPFRPALDHSRQPSALAPGAGAAPTTAACPAAPAEPALHSAPWSTTKP